MAKRGYKLQEFVAHTTNVNCLNIGKKACRLFVTGGDDHKVNLWAIGKPTSLMSLCGHTSPVESVEFDTSEVLVLAGASNGAIKLWDLDEAKMIRTLTGHRSNCTAVEFHPFGEFFASGSMDANLRIWDIRKKGCIHTYKGHTRGISTIRFTPDGRWVVSGGFDNVVKVWDLTAGKLLHDFKFHEGHITSLDFHPLEFLLATGSADKTVKFWDLETFELIGSARPEAAGVRSIAFHPDGRTLFCGLDDSLKVYSWEPVICHDAVDMGWSTLGDICIHEGKLLGCSYYRNSVGVWVADVSLIEPYGVGVPEDSEGTDKKIDIPRNHSSDKVGSGVRVTSGLRPRSPDYEIKGIKNIYVDSAGGSPVTSQKFGSLNSPKMVLPLDSKEIINPPTEKQSTIIGGDAKSNEQPHNKSFIVPTVVPRDDLVEKDSSKSGKETVTFSRTKPGMLLRPAHVRRPSNTKNEIEKMSMSVDSGTFNKMVSENRLVSEDGAQKPAHIRRPSNVKNDFEKLSLSHESGAFNKVSVKNECAIDSDLQLLEDGTQKSCGEKGSSIKSVAESFEKVVSPKSSSNDEKSDESINGTKGVTSVKIVNGVAVVAGRTRTLVERFERRERFSSEDRTSNTTPHAGTETEKTQSVETNKPEVDKTSFISPSTTLHTTPEIEKPPSMASVKIPCILSETNRTPITASSMNLRLTQETDKTPVTASDMNLPLTQETDRTPVLASSMNLRLTQETDTMPVATLNKTPCNMAETDGTPKITSNMNLHATPETDRTPSVATNVNIHVIPETNRRRSIATNMTSCVIYEAKRPPSIAPKAPPRVKREIDKSPPPQNEELQISGRDSASPNDRDVIEDLMQSHDVFSSTLKSRLTKLQVVRHFWERNDIKGAINALRKLPDQSVQADVISVLMEKMEILTLDLFSSLLPVLVGLLDSRMERHASVSLEMLLKLVAVFGPVIRSTVSAPPAVGVDLHAEQRRECCNQCFIQLQKIQQTLPALSRKGGSLAKCAMELNLVLQVP